MCEWLKWMICDDTLLILKVFVFQPFCRSTWYRHDMYTDPERQIYKKLGCLEKTTKQGRLKGLHFH